MLPARLANTLRRAVEPSERRRDLSIPRREVAKLRRWLTAAAEQVQAARVTPDVFDALRLAPPDRRGDRRESTCVDAEVRVVGTRQLGRSTVAQLIDVSEEGFALLLPADVERRATVEVTIAPPANLKAGLFRRGDGPVRLLGSVRYCRETDDGYIIGCGIGADWQDSLCGHIWPYQQRALTEPHPPRRLAS